mmetsp:Transcript_31352/g.93847  ORF Transcript_31352/g.93847 Transcript_31352/m.93847 type:complete len:163 (-) Transcript_31352:150-638(-)
MWGICVSIMIATTAGDNISKDSSASPEIYLRGGRYDGAHVERVLKGTKSDEDRHRRKKKRKKKSTLENKVAGDIKPAVICKPGEKSCTVRNETVCLLGCEGVGGTFCPGEHFEQLHTCSMCKCMEGGLPGPCNRIFGCDGDDLPIPIPVEDSLPSLEDNLLP